jgi:hypothetical protein
VNKDQRIEALEKDTIEPYNPLIIPLLPPNKPLITPLSSPNTCMQALQESIVSKDQRIEALEKETLVQMKGFDYICK